MFHYSDKLHKVEEDFYLYLAKLTKYHEMDYQRTPKD